MASLFIYGPALAFFLLIVIGSASSGEYDATIIAGVVGLVPFNLLMNALEGRKQRPK